MPKLKPLRDFLSFLPYSFLTFVALLLFAFYLSTLKIQIDNINSLEKKTVDLQTKIDRLPGITIQKDRLAIEKDSLTLEKEIVNIENAFYTSLLQSSGVIFFIITAVLTWRNVKATEEKQITERYSKAVEQLESQKIVVRIGGIYALERIARDSKKDFWIIMEVLSAFIREEKTHSHNYSGTQNNSLTLGQSINSITTDVQAALTVIKRRNPREPEEKEIDLRESYLRKANLYNANLDRACLFNVHLVEANLEKARLFKANLSEANLEGAKLIEAFLKETNLERSILREANLHKADLRNANLKQANFTGAVLTDVKFSGADLCGANFNQVTGLTQKQIERAFTDEHTILPDYLQSSQST